MSLCPCVLDRVACVPAVSTRPSRQFELEARTALRSPLRFSEQATTEHTHRHPAPPTRTHAHRSSSSSHPPTMEDEPKFVQVRPGRDDQRTPPALFGLELEVALLRLLTRSSRVLACACAGRPGVAEAAADG